MDFFGMGMGEIALIIIVALIIWGPNKMPEIIRKLGKAATTMRQTSSSLTAQIRKELEEEEKRDHSPQPKVDNSAETAKSITVNTPEASSPEKTEPESRRDADNK